MDDLQTFYGLIKMPKVAEIEAVTGFLLTKTVTDYSDLDCMFPAMKINKQQINQTFGSHLT